MFEVATDSPISSVGLFCMTLRTASISRSSCDAPAGGSFIGYPLVNAGLALSGMLVSGCWSSSMVGPCCSASGASVSRSIW